MYLYKPMKKQEKSQINNPTSHLKDFEKDQIKSKAIKRNERIKIRAKANKIVKCRIEKNQGNQKLILLKE